LERVPGVWVEKTVPELGACVRALSEVRKRGHGVDDAGFWNPTPGRPREPAAAGISLILRLFRPNIITYETVRIPPRRRFR